jgi:iduronate 2-sulfatase
LFEESLLAPLVIRVPGMKEVGVKTEAVVETVDIYPTLCELSGIAVPGGLSGESLAVDLNDPNTKGGTAISYWKDKESIRTPKYRLVRHHQKGESAFELYDHAQGGEEIVNLAEEFPEIVKELNEMIDQKLK